MWVKLGLTGNIPSGWFKMFKTNVVLAEHACSWVSDSGGYDLEKLSYWAFNQLRKNGKITYEKLSDTVQHLHTWQGNKIAVLLNYDRE